MAAPSENSRKIFLGNLHPHTNDDYKNRLKEFFGHFGEVEDVHIIIDKETGDSRGFAFLTFADVLIVERVLGEYMFDGQTIQARRATRRARPAEKHKGKGRGSNFTSGEGEDENTDANHTGQNPGSSSSGLVAGKIFVGGLHHSLNEKTLREYFERFGEIANAIILYDQTTKNSRGFGFVTFREESSADKLLNHPGSHELGGKVVEVKRATPRKDTPRRQFSNSGSLWEKGSLHSHPYGDRRSDANEPYYIHADMHPGGPPSVGYVQHQQYVHQQASIPHYHNQPGFVPMQFQQPPYFPHGCNVIPFTSPFEHHRSDVNTITSYLPSSI